MYIPLVVIFINSFNGNSAMGNWTGGFTFKPYINLFSGSHTKEIMMALLNSMIIALSSSLLALIFGTLGAVGINSMKKKWRNAINTTAKVPMINAEIITAISFMIFFGALQLPPGYVTLIIAHTAFCTPYVLLSVLPKLQQVNDNTYEAALDLGATPMKALTRVVFPQILPAMISGVLMAFTISLDDFVITQFNIEGFNTFTTYIYTEGLKRPLPPEVRALSVLIFLFALAMLIVANRMSNRSKGEKIKK